MVSNAYIRKTDRTVKESDRNYAGRLVLYCNIYHAHYKAEALMPNAVMRPVSFSPSTAFLKRRPESIGMTEMETKRLRPTAKQTAMAISLNKLPCLFLKKDDRQKDRNRRDSGI